MINYTRFFSLVILIVFLSSFVFIQHVKAISEITINDEKVATLIKEETDGEKIYRVYETEEGELLNSYISIPVEVQKNIKNSPDRLFLAKKELTRIYLSLDLKLRLAELDNYYVEMYRLTNLKISDELKENFEKERVEAYKYAVKEKEKFDQLTKEEKNKLYNTGNHFYRDYDKVDEMTPEQKEYYKDIDELIEENEKYEGKLKDEVKKDEGEKKEPNVFLILSISILVIGGTITYFALKRRGSDE